MKIMLIPLAFIIIATALLMPGCNSAAKTFGGTVTINLPPNVKCVNVTWKEANVWVLQRPKNKEESCHTTYNFQEYSNYGLIEAKVIVIESEQ